MTSTSCWSPSWSRSPSRLIRAIPLGHQRDVVALDRVEDAVLGVDDDRPGRRAPGAAASSSRRARGRRACCFEERDAARRARLVAPGCTRTGSSKLGIDLGQLRSEPARYGRASAHEVGVERQVAVEPADLRRERRAIAGRSANSHCGVRWKTVDVLRLERQLRDHLVAGAPGADHGDPLAAADRCPRASAPCARTALEVRRRPRSRAGSGRLRKPTAVITAFERSVRSPSGPSMRISHIAVVLVPGQRAHLGVERRCRSRRSNVSATQSK